VLTIDLERRTVHSEAPAGQGVTGAGGGHPVVIAFVHQ
jgi:hypothetical protein